MADLSSSPLSSAPSSIDERYAPASSNAGRDRDERSALSPAPQPSSYDGDVSSIAMPSSADRRQLQPQPRRIVEERNSIYSQGSRQHNPPIPGPPNFMHHDPSSFARSDPNWRPFQPPPRNLGPGTPFSVALRPPQNPALIKSLLDPDAQALDRLSFLPPKDYSYLDEESELQPESLVVPNRYQVIGKSKKVVAAAGALAPVPVKKPKEKKGKGKLHPALKTARERFLGASKGQELYYKNIGPVDNIAPVAGGAFHSFSFDTIAAPKSTKWIRAGALYSRLLVRESLFVRCFYFIHRVIGLEANIIRAGGDLQQPPTDRDEVSGRRQGIPRRRLGECD